MQTSIVRQPPNDSGEASAVPDHPSAGQSAANFSRAKSNGSKNRSNSTAADRGLIEALVNAKVFQEYERAFTDATGLPVALRPVETWQLPHHGKRNESPFCALVSEKSRACSSCLQVQEKLSEAATEAAHTVVCPAGLCDTRRAGSPGGSSDRVSANRPGVSQASHGSAIRAHYQAGAGLGYYDRSRAVAAGLL